MGRGARWWLATGGAALLLVLLAFGQVHRETNECGLDTSYCAYADRGTERYRGRLFTLEGRPMPTRIRFKLNSLKGGSPELATDRQGRYCVDFLRERVTPYPDFAAAPSTLPIDPRFRTPEGHAAVAVARERGLTYVVLTEYKPQGRPASNALEYFAAGGAWREEIDGTTTCAQPGRVAPWYRYDDLGSSWQGVLLKALPLGGLFVLLLLAATPLRRGRRAWLIPAAGYAVVAAQVAIAAVLWGAL